MSDTLRPKARRPATRREFTAILAIVATVVVLVAGAVPYLLGARTRWACQANLKRLGEALHMYAAEAEGEYYPHAKYRDCAGAIQPWSGAIDLGELDEDYFAEYGTLVCPTISEEKTALALWDGGHSANPRWAPIGGHSYNSEIEPCEVLGKPYYYYGWALSEKLFESTRAYPPVEPEDAGAPVIGDGLTVVREYHDVIHNWRFRQAVATMADEMVQADALPDDEWELHYPTGKAAELPRGSTIYRLREGVERHFLDDIGNPSAAKEEGGRIVLMHEEVVEDHGEAKHAGGKVNVLYMDNHVESLAWKSSPARRTFPLNEAGLILHDAVDGVLKQTPRPLAE